MVVVQRGSLQICRGNGREQRQSMNRCSTQVDADAPRTPTHPVIGVPRTDAAAVRRAIVESILFVIGLFDRLRIK
jgi:hypothetical protein